MRPTPSASLTPDGVGLGASVTVPGVPPRGSGGSGTGAGPGTGGGGVGTGGGTDTGARAGEGTGGAPVPRGPVCDPTGIICRDLYTVTSTLEELDAALEGRGPVTVADLVNFRPEVSAHLSEPDGWTVVGLHTNFFTGTSGQVHDDLLLGIPASVRFTPVAFRWDYGDGEAATSATGGASWAELGLDEFDRTGTSHLFREEGTYRVDLTIDFAAEYRFGTSGWIPIAGTVAAAADPLTVRATGASLVLVERDCTVRPTAPGC